MTEPLEILTRVGVRKRRRLLPLFYGPAVTLPDAAFLKALDGELGEPGSSAPTYPFSIDLPGFFALDVEVDSIYAAFTAISEDETPKEDRRGFLEVDGIAVDALLGRRRPGAEVELVLLVSRFSGKWSSRRFRRIVDRLRRVFGEDGRALVGAFPRFVALGPERPSPAQTASWPRWMLRSDGTARWLPYGPAPGERKLLRCDRKGRPRRGGEFWKFS